MAHAPAGAKRTGPGYVLLLAFGLYALDQLTKWLVIWNLEFESGYRVIIPGWFELVHFANTGAAFGWFRDGNTFFIALSLVTLVVLCVLWRRGFFADRWLRTGLGLLTSGILGNVTDRLVHGHVVDFLLFDLHVPFANPWPAFNVADSCICIATALFVIHSIQHPDSPVK